jgi:hypothetical protein
VPSPGVSNLHQEVLLQRSGLIGPTASRARHCHLGNRSQGQEDKNSVRMWGAKHQLSGLLCNALQWVPFTPAGLTGKGACFYPAGIPAFQN